MVPKHLVILSQGPLYLGCNGVGWGGKSPGGIDDVVREGDETRKWLNDGIVHLGTSSKLP